MSLFNTHIVYSAYLSLNNKHTDGLGIKSIISSTGPVNVLAYFQMADHVSRGLPEV